MKLICTWWEAQPDKQRVLLATACLLLTVLTVGWISFMPLLTTAQALTARKEQLAADVGALTVVENTVAEQEKTRLQLLDANGVWQKKLPNQVQTPEILRLLDGQALQAGVRIAAVKPQAARANASLAEFPFEVTATGDFFAARRFLQQLETQTAPSMKVVSFTLTADPAGGLKQQYVLAVPGLALPKSAAGSGAARPAVPGAVVGQQ